MASSNIINAVFGSGICAVTTSAYRANYGMVLRFSGIDLPTAFECDFSNYDTSNNDSITAIGQDNEVQIPDQLWDSGLNIYAYVYLHPTDDSGVTVYTVTIPVLGRPNRTDEQPTPHEQSVIEQAISALNDAVEQTAADVVAADAYASAAAQSEANAATSERASAASAGAALASQNAAESASQSATESASGAAESARNAAVSAAQAAQSATDAQEYAEQAEQSAQSISGDVERAEQAATTATGKATEAATSATTANGAAQTATGKAAQAEQSATAAAQSATNAAASATAAANAQTAAETAQGKAEDAQAAAEQAAQSVSGLSAQIAQNTADIADLVQSKAGALIDTVSGSIASFVPDSTVPTVNGLTVDIEPVQDLHGYDSPWPAGGGKNLFDASTFPTVTKNGVTCTNNGNGSFTLNGTATQDTFFDIFANQFSHDKGGTELPTNSYRITGCPANGSIQTYYMYIYPSYTRDYGNGATSQSTNIGGGSIFVKNGYTCNNLVFWPMLRISTNGDDTFAPYSNICPISGWDEVVVWDDPAYAGTIEWNQLSKAAFISPYTHNGVTWVKSADEYSVTASGTVAGYSNSYVQLTGNSGVVVGHKYYICSGSKTGKVLIWYNGVGGISQSVERIGTITAIANGFYLRINGEGVSVDETVKPQIFDLTEMFGAGNEPSTVEEFKALFPKDYYPYDDSYTETCVSAVNGDPYLNYTIQLGQTVYGGTVDAVNGVLTVTHAEYVFTGNEVWQASATPNRFFVNGMNSYLPYNMAAQPMAASAKQNVNSSIFGTFAYVNADGVGYIVSSTNESRQLVINTTAATTIEDIKSIMTGSQLVYELATPITIDLTPIEIAVITGQTNNVWADSGDVSVEYAADLKHYIDTKIAAAVAAMS